MFKVTKAFDFLQFFLYVVHALSHLDVKSYSRHYLGFEQLNQLFSQAKNWSFFLMIIKLYSETAK